MCEQIICQLRRIQTKNGRIYRKKRNQRVGIAWHGTGQLLPMPIAFPQLCKVLISRLLCQLWWHVELRMTKTVETKYTPLHHNASCECVSKFWILLHAFLKSWFLVAPHLCRVALLPKVRIASKEGGLALEPRNVHLTCPKSFFDRKVELLMICDIIVICRKAAIGHCSLESTHIPCHGPTCPFHGR